MNGFATAIVCCGLLVAGLEATTPGVTAGAIRTAAEIWDNRDLPALIQEEIDRLTM